ncbi:hypothetical protein [Paraburkholderia graminis]|uniref:Uncharacterized protein n=1 Tax=Paraburkholderia graminis TaxID=60548 RepID=A0ABD5CBT2_9BURK|nr:hypothetical protein [Paraburkholderia graminis]MDR6202498.1 hypothetical protein [Paraburkholderia graminis]
MDTTDQNKVSAPDDAQRLIEQLDALQPGKQQQKTLQFQKLYPAIERALAREVPQKAIITELEKMGLHLSVGGFRSLLEVERKLRTESGDRVCCEHCGSNLTREGDDDNAS